MLSIPLKRTLARQNTKEGFKASKNLIIIPRQANFSLFENRPSPLVGANCGQSNSRSGIPNLLEFCNILEQQLKEKPTDAHPSLSEKSAALLSQTDNPLHRPNSEIRVVSTFRTPSEHEKYQQNFYLELMAPFTNWNSEESKKYLSKRKMKRKAFK